MRLWSLNPTFLDTKGLGGLWREGLGGLAALKRGGGGYYNHPQLERFKAHHNPVGALQCYMEHVFDEACDRGYNYNRSLIAGESVIEQFRLNVTMGQLEYELQHLIKKLRVRDPSRASLVSLLGLQPHPIFDVVEGPIERWEKVTAL